MPKFGDSPEGPTEFGDLEKAWAPLLAPKEQITEEFLPIPAEGNSKIFNFTRYTGRLGMSGGFVSTVRDKLFGRRQQHDR